MQFSGLYTYFIKLYYPAVRGRCLCCKTYNKQLSRGYSDEQRTLQFRACAVKWEWENKYINFYQKVVILTSESFETLRRKSLFGGPLKVPSGTTSTHLQSAMGELDELCKLSVGWPKRFTLPTPTFQKNFQVCGVHQHRNALSKWLCKSLSDSFGCIKSTLSLPGLQHQA